MNPTSPVFPAAPTGPARPGTSGRAGTPTVAPQVPGPLPDGARSATARSSASRRAPSVVAALRWERRKASGRWYWPLIAVLCAVGLASGWGQYLDYRADFAAQGVTWAALWGQASLLPSMLFIPLAAGAYVAQVAVAERQGRNWQRLAAGGLASTMIRGKLWHALEVALGTTLVFVAELVAAGLALGFDPGRLGPFLVRIVPVTLSLWAIEVIVMWLGARLASFAGVMTAVLVATMGGFGLTVVMPAVASVYPMSLMTSAFSARSPGSLASMGSVLAACVIAVSWAGLAGLALRRAVRCA